VPEYPLSCLLDGDSAARTRLKAKLTIPTETPKHTKKASANDLFTKKDTGNVERLSLFMQKKFVKINVF
jgi:hypothetical protein